MPEKGEGNKRQDFRVDDVLPMSDRPLTTEEYESMRTRIGIRSRKSSILHDILGKEMSIRKDDIDESNQDLVKVLDMLDAKMNYLIGVETLREAQDSNLDERAASISATGLSFLTHERYKVGDHLEVTMMLPLFPPDVIDILLEVKRVDEQKKYNQIRVGGQFEFRCEDERLCVAEYVYRRQRELIRLQTSPQEGVDGQGV